MGKGETAGGDLTTVIRSMISMNKGTNWVIMRTVAAFALALALALAVAVALALALAVAVAVAAAAVVVVVVVCCSGFVRDFGRLRFMD